MKQMILTRPDRSDEIVASIMAASFSPSARIGPVAAIMLSIHTMKRIAAEDTQKGEELIGFKDLLPGSIRFIPQ